MEGIFQHIGVILLKEIYRRTGSVWIPGAIGTAVVALCVVLGLLSVMQGDYFWLVILFFPAMIGMLLLFGAWSEYRSTIELDDVGMKINYRVFSKSKELNKAGVFLPYDRISHIRKALRPGDGYNTQDCFLYTVKLTDGRELELYLYHFKNQEEAICRSLSQRVTVQRFTPADPSGPTGAKAIGVLSDVMEIVRQIIGLFS